MYFLIIDDDADSREGLAELIRLDGHSVATGTAALDVFQHVNKMPDVVILDYFMPGRDGISLLKHMREDLGWRLVPVILITGYAGIDLPTGPRGPFGGPFCLLLKPVTVEQIYAAVANLKYLIFKGWDIINGA